MYFDAGEALPGQEFSGELSSSRQLADEGQMNTYFVLQHSTIWDDSQSVFKSIYFKHLL